MKKVAMIGVGKLGQDCAEVMAQHYDVVGYDVAPRQPTFPMRGSIEEAVRDRDFIFIAAPTPHDPVYGGETPTSHLPNKDFDYSIVSGILDEVNKHVNQNQLVILISTVLPGTVRNQLRPKITNARFIYNPYLIAMGTIKWDMVNPEMVIIGTDDGDITHDAKELIDFYKVFMENNPRYEVGTWDEAESIKIFYNTFISAKLSLVNMIQDVAEVNGNINVDVVTNALAKSTHRIMGPAYMKAGLGDAGACHPRDNIALRYLAERLDLKYDLFDAIMAAREVQAERMALRCLKNGKNVTIIGKAYKPGVPYTNGSASMLVGYYIEKHGGNLNYYDPNTGDYNLRHGWTQVYLIGYWEPYVEQLYFPDPGAVVIDPWRRITSPQHTGEIIHYGDTRLHHNYAPESSTISTMTRQVFDIWPELEEENSIHVIDATISMGTTFVLRPTEDVIADILTAKTNGKTKFLFFAMTEGVMPYVLSKMQRIASILDGVIEPEALIYLTASVDGEEAYLKLKERNSWNKRLTILSAYFQWYISKRNAAEFKYIGEYDVGSRGKTFVCLNKVNREHRMELLEKMLAYDFVDRGYYSFEGADNWLENEFDNLLDEKYPNIKANKDRFPMRLNITEDRPNPVDFRMEDLSYHRNSYFSIITETIFYDSARINLAHKPAVENSIFVTEKTYRAVAMLHPFVLFARPGMLADLKRQGFKTFAPYINESYDKIENDDERFAAVFSEIQRLMKFNSDDWDFWQKGIKEAVDHNKWWFHENKDFRISSAHTIAVPSIAAVEQPDQPVTFVVEQYDPDPMVVEPAVLKVTPIEEPIQLSTDVDWTNRSHRLENKIVLNFPVHLDGGGFLMRDALAETIKLHGGKATYDRALEWCAGFGPLGFDLLDRDMTKTVVFSDMYDIAIDTCLANAKENMVDDKVTGYVTGKIGDIPSTEKWDLVVSNPPHCKDKSELINNLPDKTFLNNVIRLTVDENFEIHREFFNNIRQRLTDDADIFLIENSRVEEFISMAEQGGLSFVAYIPLSGVECLPHGGIFHFKVKT